VRATDRLRLLSAALAVVIAVCHVSTASAAGPLEVERTPRGAEGRAFDVDDDFPDTTGDRDGSRGHRASAAPVRFVRPSWDEARRLRAVRIAASHAPVQRAPSIPVWRRAARRCAPRQRDDGHDQ
jgi:hypothetical protein